MPAVSGDHHHLAVALHRAGVQEEVTRGFVDGDPVEELQDLLGDAVGGVLRPGVSSVEEDAEAAGTALAAVEDRQDGGRGSVGCREAGEHHEQFVAQLRVVGAHLHRGGGQPDRSGAGRPVDAVEELLRPLQPVTRCRGLCLIVIVIVIDGDDAGCGEADQRVPNVTVEGRPIRAGVDGELVDEVGHGAATVDADPDESGAGVEDVRRLGGGVEDHDLIVDHGVDDPGGQPGDVVVLDRSWDRGGDREGLDPLRLPARHAGRFALRALWWGGGAAPWSEPSARSGTTRCGAYRPGSFPQWVLRSRMRVRG